MGVVRETDGRFRRGEHTDWDLACLPARIPPSRDHPVPGREGVSSAAVARTDHPFAIRTAASVAWRATSVPSPARWIVSHCRPRRTRPAVAIPSSSASISRGASSAVSARRRARLTPSSSRLISRWASTAARTLCTKRRIVNQRPGKVPGLQLLPRRRTGDGGKDKGEAENEEPPVDLRPAVAVKSRNTMNVVFYISALVAVAATAMVVTCRSAIHALLYLIMSLMAVALVFFVLGAPLSPHLKSSSTRGRSWSCSSSF